MKGKVLLLAALSGWEHQIELLGTADLLWLPLEVQLGVLLEVQLGVLLGVLLGVPLGVHLVKDSRHLARQ
jgi:hypothetical protein